MLRREQLCNNPELEAAHLGPCGMGPLVQQSLTGTYQFVALTASPIKTNVISKQPSHVKELVREPLLAIMANA